MRRVGAEAGPPALHPGSPRLPDLCSFQVINSQHHEPRGEEGWRALTVLK